MFVRKFKAMSKDVQSSLDPLVTVRLMKKLKTSSTWEVKKNSALFLSVTIIDVLLFFLWSCLKLQFTMLEEKRIYNRTTFFILNILVNL